MFIPLTKKISWRNPPYITIAIILINVFVFFVIQAGDARNENQAHAFYFESGLNQIEFPLYLDFLKSHRPDAYKEFESIDFENDPDGLMSLYRSLIFDKAFLDRLADGELGPTDILKRSRHQTLREAYQQRLDKVVSLQFGFRPARHRMATWVTTMFLHGSVGHLLGNMLFLWLIGCLIEYGCRRWLFAVIYLLGGFAATGLFWALNAESLVPLIGASGAISGIMGAFAVFYGFKRVRVFLNLGFYFNYLRFPAIVMLPFWIGNEWFQMMTNDGSSVAYAAHLGGLVGGSALAFILSRIPDLLDNEGFEGAEDDPVQPMVEKALAHMGRIEFTAARELLAAADSLQPDNTAILSHMFTIDRQDPDKKEFHTTTLRLLKCLLRQPESYTQAHSIYRKYIEAARPAKLGAAMYVQLCRIFCEIGELDDAQRLVSVLVKKRPDLSEVPALLMKLAGFHGRKGNQKYRKACLSCVCKQYPLSSEAEIARQQLATELKN
jgi:membrane associated rhomboid family serine protease